MSSLYCNVVYYVWCKVYCTRCREIY